MMKGRGKRLMIAGAVLLSAACALLAFNQWDDHRVTVYGQKLIRQLEEEKKAGTENAKKNSTREGMPTLTVDGREILGTITIPVLDLTLPVQAEWSDAALRYGPCRYQGSVPTKDMILAGHNYRSQFGSLHLLQIGDEILFTDITDREYWYQVSEVVTIDGYDVEEMENGTWDLTIFTCNYGGGSRVTIRCRETVGDGR